jgi:error-prone DNA polymerase
VNASAGDWRVEGVGGTHGLRAGLNEVKGISGTEVAQIVAGQPYTSLRDFWERAAATRPVAERLVRIGAFDPICEPPVTRRDLLVRLGVLARSSARLFTGLVTTKSRDQLPLDLGGGDGLAELVPGGQLREMTAAERVEAELEILGIDLSRHVMSFYEGLMAELGVVYSADLQRCSAGDRVLVAGVKVATQTPAIRSGQRIIFATLDDATGPVDLAFFESVQERCAATVFASSLLAVRGRVRRAGRSVSVNAAGCWDLPALAEIHAVGGTGAVRAAMAAGDVPGPPRSAEPGPGGPPKIMYPNGFTLSPYAETGAPGDGRKDPPRLIWHASPGGGRAGRDPQSLVTFWIIVTIAISPRNLPATADPSRWA